jgi:hypothetical protein
MNKKYDNNNIIIASRAYFLQSLVYLFGISPTVTPRELQDRHLHMLCLVKFIRHSSSSFCIWMAVLDVPPFFMPQSAIDSGLRDVVSAQRDSWDPLDLTTKSAVTFAT